MSPIPLVIILLLTAAIEGKTRICPPATDIAPCTCQIVTPKEEEAWVTCSYLPSLTALTASVKGMKDYQIDKLVLEHSDFGYIPSNMFLHTSIREVIVKSMKLTNIGSQGEVVFQGQEKILESIAIRRCKLNPGIEWEKINQLNTLQSLELNKNDLSQFPPSWFRFSSKSLRFVYLIENEIKAIDENAFHELTKLVELDLSENNIGTLNRSMFPMPADFLTFLRLNDNEISSLPEDFFLSMTALKRVNLANNKLQTIQESVWKQKFSQLSYLDLLGNEIQCDCGIIWTLDSLKPDYYYGECAGVKYDANGKVIKVWKKLSKIYVTDLQCSFTNRDRKTKVTKRTH